MGLKTVVDSEAFGELDEGTKSLYKQGEGDHKDKYILDIEGIDDHPHVVGLKNGHTRSKDERRQFKEKYENLTRRLQPMFEYLGDDAGEFDLKDVDEERVEKAVKLLKGDEVDLGGGGGTGGNKDKDGNVVDIDKIKASARKPLERENETLKQQNERLSGQLNSTVVEGALTAALDEAKIRGPYKKAVASMFKNMVKVTEDEDGNPVPVIDGEYGEQPVAKHIQEWSQTDEGREFVEPSGSGGGGASGSGGPSGKVKNPWSPDNWNMAEQGRIYREDSERAKRMAAEHGRTVGS